MLDYSVLAVVVITLGLILSVELFRHFLDHHAKNKPFFMAMLATVYSECK